MSVLPRRLSARTFLLVGLLLLLSHSAAIALFYVNFAWPAAERSATSIAEHWQTLHAALQALPADRRARFLEDLAARGVPLRKSFDSARLSAPTNFQEDLIRRVRRRLGGAVPVQITSEIPSRLWLPLTSGQERYWVGFVQRTPGRPLSVNLLRQSLVIFALALAGAWLVARVINRPLVQLADAAGQVGRGETPAPLPDRGPQEVRVVHSAFNQMARNVKQAADDRALLLAGVSHDLRTPLARLRLALEMSGERLDPSLRPGMEQDIEDIDLIIGQFSTYVREGADEPFALGDLNVLVRQIAERYAQQGQPLELALCDAPAVWLKPVALRRALTNLVENGLRHGGGAVEVRTSVADRYVVVAVLDRGPGVTQQEIERLRRPFTPVDSRGERGLHGLGLAIVDRVARLHRGALGLAPRPGGGLEVRLELPIRAPAELRQGRGTSGGV